MSDAPINPPAAAPTAEQVEAARLDALRETDPVAWARAVSARGLTPPSAAPALPADATPRQVWESLRKVNAIAAAAYALQNRAAVFGF